MIPLDYGQINGRALNLLLSVKKHVKAIDDNLATLVELRVSQINGCAFCIDLHSREARELGESRERLEGLPAFRESPCYSDREKAALDWAEAVTGLVSEADLEGKLADLQTVFSEAEVVDLTFVISLMNCLNRMSISMRDKPPGLPDQDAAAGERRS